MRDAKDVDEEALRTFISKIDDKHITGKLKIFDQEKKEQSKSKSTDIDDV